MLAGLNPMRSTIVPTEERGENAGQDREKAGDSHLRGAACRLVDVPGNGDGGQCLSNQRDRIGQQERDDGKAIAGLIHRRIPFYSSSGYPPG
jgi:hypothetical protein